MDWTRLSDQIQKDIEKNMSSKRFQHTLAVMECAKAIASHWGIAPMKAAVAALLHDVAREWPLEKQCLYYEKANIDGFSFCAQEVPALLHGPAGSQWASDNYDIVDKDVLDAISFHTLGHPKMGDLAKIIYLSDKIEVNRTYNGVEEIRKWVEKSIDKALLLSLDQTIVYVVQKGHCLHPLTVETRNLFLHKLQ
ncbi:bis(5'-nucleosyl)-tetraphosphatase (symmetrical) YqeK [Heliorestis convoluta]|uniref:bis(5'-nucleosyl)-tetraphosphatase (symmetrical) n=1 Tax=Heliorestis convoluta TaxID=356322 RepID=A0A5Q2MXH9_9FIRM|nr:bis(5'-nucleosyl)-tetraphosphatase (symmetrical) YqeK [Heliorestis convoluta]QGG47237.1 HD domain-containing protein [Heliorestis convoluta]